MGQSRLPGYLLLLFLVAASLIWWRGGLRVPGSPADQQAQAVEQGVAALELHLPGLPTPHDADVYITLPNGQRWIVAYRRHGSRAALPWNVTALPGQAVAETGQVLPLPAATVGDPADMTLERPPSITADQIEAILGSYSSPALGSGAAWVAMGQKYGIDPAYGVAFFIMESTAGTAQGWAGLKADGSTTHNIGNIICTPGFDCYNGHRDYPTWEAGIEGWFDLIRREYIDGRGLRTVGEVLPIYAPSNDSNDTDGYARTVAQLVEGWRSAQLAIQETLPDPPPAPDVAAAPPPVISKPASGLVGSSNPITIVEDGGFGTNVRAALDANGGGLWRVEIAPGQTWSFNQTVGNPDDFSYTTVAGVPGGGWCNLAERYVEAVRPILPDEAIRFQHHGFALDGEWRNAVAIWNVAGEPGFDGPREDLMLTNVLPVPITLVATPDADGARVQVQAYLGT